jgi:hypothetical protein
LAVLAPPLAAVPTPRWVPLFTGSFAGPRPVLPPAARLPGASIGVLCSGGVDALTPDDLILSAVDYHCSNVMQTVLTPAVRAQVEGAVRGHAEWLAAERARRTGTEVSAEGAAAAASVGWVDVEEVVKGALWHYRSGLSNKTAVHTLGADALQPVRTRLHGPSALGQGELAVAAALDWGERAWTLPSEGGAAGVVPAGASQCAWALTADPARSARVMDEDLLLWRVFGIVRDATDRFAKGLYESRRHGK